MPTQSARPSSGPSGVPGWAPAAASHIELGSAAAASFLGFEAYSLTLSNAASGWAVKGTPAVVMPRCSPIRRTARPDPCCSSVAITSVLPEVVRDARGVNRPHRTTPRMRIAWYLIRRSGQYFRMLADFEKWFWHEVSDRR
jgi:hypothetical protein